MSIKFYGVKIVPPRYIDALRQALDASNGQYGTSSCSAIEKNRCNRCGAVCTGGGLGYYYQYPDGTEVLRCGAYPIAIPVMTREDVEEMKKVIMEQHEYFLSIA